MVPRKIIDAGFGPTVIVPLNMYVPGEPVDPIIGNSIVPPVPFVGPVGLSKLLTNAFRFVVFSPAVLFGLTPLSRALNMPVGAAIWTSFHLVVSNRIVIAHVFKKLVHRG